MPARNHRFRALDAEFCAFLEEREAWPKRAAYLKVLEKLGGGRPEDFKSLMQGGTVPEKHGQVIVRMLRGNPVLGEFLQSRGVGDVTRLNDDQLIGLVAGPVQFHLDPSDDGDEAFDWILFGYERIAQVFTRFVYNTLIRHGTLCKHEEDVKTAVVMLMATIGRDIGKNEKLPTDEAIKECEGLMQISFDDYLLRAIDLWRCEKWSIVFAVDNRRRVGCSLVLPLKASSYDEFRGGDRDSHSLLGRDLAVPSCSFFVEAAGLKSEMELPSLRDKSFWVIRTIVLQIAIMSLDAERSLAGEHLRLIAIDGTPSNKKRLINWGYKPTGNKMPGFDLELVEMDAERAWYVAPTIKKVQERLVASGETF